VSIVKGELQEENRTDRDRRDRKPEAIVFTAYSISLQQDFEADDGGGFHGNQRTTNRRRKNYDFLETTILLITSITTVFIRQSVYGVSSCKVLTVRCFILH
jgi:hypothetical protein